VKVAFYLENRFTSHIDLRQVRCGNPGVGGSEYMIALMAQLLATRDNGIDVTLYAQVEGEFPEGVDTVLVENLKACIAHCCAQKIEYLFFKHVAGFIDDGTLETSTYTKLCPWCHNFASPKQLDYYDANKMVARIICVGSEQRDLYRDMHAYEKSEYLYNCISEEEIAACHVEEHPFGQRPNRVVYIGAIGKQKGFHWLAEAWPKVLQQVPDAELYVIGSGSLYGANAKLGKWGIADESYEQLFMPYLTHSVDGKQEILPSVHFMGILGKEKNDILLKAKVGVPNPSGFSETFGISAVEMQSMGCCISTIRCAGYLDTVVNGVLYHRRDELADSIVSLLRSDGGDYAATLQYILSHFSQQAVAQEWERFILESLPSGEWLHVPAMKNGDFENKYRKERLRQLKRKMPVLYGMIPTVDFMTRIQDKLLRRNTCHPHRNKE